MLSSNPVIASKRKRPYSIARMDISAYMRPSRAPVDEKPSIRKKVEVEKPMKIIAPKGKNVCKSRKKNGEKNQKMSSFFKPLAGKTSKSTAAGNENVRNEEEKGEDIDFSEFKRSEITLTEIYMKRNEFYSNVQANFNSEDFPLLLSFKVFMKESLKIQWTQIKGSFPKEGNKGKLSLYLKPTSPIDIFPLSSQEIESLIESTLMKGIFEDFSYSLCQRYQPYKSSEAVNNTELEKVRDWLSSSLSASNDDDLSEYSNSSSFMPLKRKALLLVGPEGIGKSMALKTSANDMQIEIMEISNSKKRSRNELNKLSETMQAKRIMLSHKFTKKSVDEILSPSNGVSGSELGNRNCRKLLFFRDFDIALSEDSQFVQAVGEIIRKSKYPVVMTAKNNTFKHMNSSFESIHYKPLQPLQAATLLFFILQTEIHIRPFVRKGNFCEYLEKCGDGVDLDFEDIVSRFGNYNCGLRNPYQDWENTINMTDILAFCEFYSCNLLKIFTVIESEMDEIKTKGLNSFVSNHIQKEYLNSYSITGNSLWKNVYLSDIQSTIKNFTKKSHFSKKISQNLTNLSFDRISDLNSSSESLEDICNFTEDKAFHDIFNSRLTKLKSGNNTKHVLNFFLYKSDFIYYSEIRNLSNLISEQENLEICLPKSIKYNMESLLPGIIASKDDILRANARVKYSKKGEYEIHSFFTSMSCLSMIFLKSTRRSTLENNVPTPKVINDFLGNGKEFYRDGCMGYSGRMKV